MNSRNGPLSPISIGGGSDWSGLSKYQNLESEGGYSPVSNSRGKLATPPISTGSNGPMNGAAFPARGSSGGSPGGGQPSPPSSIARSSVGTGLYAGMDSGRRGKDEQFEAALAEHYGALKRFLAAFLKDEKGNPRPNRARDKLLRLSAVQFQELSTDVYDELLRRQENSRPTPNGASDPNLPQFLLPKDSFHPKRNQARQKLSTLPPPRFRDLATDVFYELERRFPRFAGDSLSRMGSPASMRPPNRSMTGTPVGGSGQSRMRRPSDASSLAGYSVRSESRNGPRIPAPNGGLDIPPSPGLPPGNFGRPTPKQFQSNTIVPNKSTMVEDDETGGEDNDDDDGDAFGLEGAARGRASKKSTDGLEVDKKVVEEYRSQVAELQGKLDLMENKFKQKEDELNTALDGERSRATAANAEKQEWTDLRIQLESKVADAQTLHESLQSELTRLRSSHVNTERELRTQVEQLQAANDQRGAQGNSELQRENDELRIELQDQQQMAEEVRQEAQTFLREMRMLSERSTGSYEREADLVSTIERLEKEVQDWRNRYAKTKTQLRNLRASSIGLTVKQDVGKSLRDSAFAAEEGYVKDVHISKFQISIDELLTTARGEDPSRVIEFMKLVVVNVRRITQDIDEGAANKGALSPQQIKLKSRVSATANNLITASKNFAASNGLSPVSLLDAAASHLTAAIVELVRTVKIRPTPAGELDDDDDGNLDMSGSPSYFSERQSQQENVGPAFAGLRNGHTSGNSSMYSMNTPRQSTDVRSRSSRNPNGLSISNGNTNKILPLAPMGVGFGIRTQSADVEDLKIYLEDQTALLVSTIQSLVASIRSKAEFTTISGQITAIASVVDTVVKSTETAMSSTGNAPLRAQGEPILRRLSNCRQMLVTARETGQAIAEDGADNANAEEDWMAWNQSLPPIAFEIARETKELMGQVDALDVANSSAPLSSGLDEDFS